MSPALLLAIASVTAVFNTGLLIAQTRRQWHARRRRAKDPMKKTQPAAGDGILVCAHHPSPHDGSHVFWFGRPTPCMRPDGRPLVAEWVLLCDRCFVRYAGDVFACPIAGDLVWPEGAEPLTYRSRS